MSLLFHCWVLGLWWVLQTNRQYNGGVQVERDIWSNYPLAISQFAINKPIQIGSVPNPSIILLYWLVYRISLFDFSNPEYKKGSIIPYNPLWSPTNRGFEHCSDDNRSSNIEKNKSTAGAPCQRPRCSPLLPGLSAPCRWWWHWPPLGGLDLNWRRPWYINGFIGRSIHGGTPKWIQIYMV